MDTYPLMSLRDVAHRLNVSVRTVHTLRRRGTLRVVKIGNRTLVRAADLSALIAAAAEPAFPRTASDAPEDAA